MWKAVANILVTLPPKFVRVLWVPSHLLDQGKEDELEQFLATGGDMELLKGNQAADVVADRGAGMDPPDPSLQLKDKLVFKLACAVQTMQIMIWAAYQGHVASDQEIDASKVVHRAESEDLIPDLGFDEDDPFLQAFLAQDDCAEIEQWQGEVVGGLLEGAEEHEPSGHAIHYSEVKDEGNICESSGNDHSQLMQEQPDPSAELGATLEMSVGQRLRSVQSDILKSARHYTFLDDPRFKSGWRCQLKQGVSLTDVLMDVTLGRARLEVPGGNKITVKCLLTWIEPFIWALQQTRWTATYNLDIGISDRRKTTMSWLELTAFVGILTGRSVGPRGASFLVNTAICKHLWKRVGKFLEVADAGGSRQTLTAFGSPVVNAGASVTCGIAN
jgi:hypothetical protein